MTLRDFTMTRTIAGAEGFPTVIVHGALKATLMAQV